MLVASIRLHWVDALLHLRLPRPERHRRATRVQQGAGDGLVPARLDDHRLRAGGLRALRGHHQRRPAAGRSGADAAAVSALMSSRARQRQRPCRRTEQLGRPGATVRRRTGANVLYAPGSSVSRLASRKCCSRNSSSIGDSRSDSSPPRGSWRPRTSEPPAIAAPDESPRARAAASPSISWSRKSVAAIRRRVSGKPDDTHDDSTVAAGRGHERPPGRGASPPGCARRGCGTGLTAVSVRRASPWTDWPVTDGPSFVLRAEADDAALTMLNRGALTAQDRVARLSV